MLQKLSAGRSTDLPGALDNILEIARVPSSRHRADLRALIEQLIKSRWREHSPEFIAECDGRRRQWITRLRRVRLARNSLRKVATELKLAIVDYDKHGGKRARLDEIAPAPIDRLLNEVLGWTEKDPPYFARNNRRGRPPGPSRYQFYIFVCILLELVKDCGGRLTFDKNYPDKGLLPRALCLLRSHLPAGFIPSTIPTRTLIEARRAVGLSSQNGTKNRGAQKGKPA